VTADPDVVVIGSGPNGLVAACTLARQGLRVRVLEAHPGRPGGAVSSAELTLPGFIHDVGAGFFPLVQLSPAFAELDLERLGVAWAHARYDSCHPARDGSYACISRDPSVTAEHFGSPRDGAKWRDLALRHSRIQEPLLDALLQPFPHLPAIADLGPLELARLARTFLSRGRYFSARHFESTAAQRVLPALALHADVGPDDALGAGLGYVLGMVASSAGFPVALGGAQTITNALLTLLERHGGRLELGQRVTQIVVSNRRARAVRTDRGDEVAVHLGVLADTSAPSLLLDLLEPRDVPSRLLRRMRRFPRTWGVFKMDWALGARVPWTVEAARESAVVHTGEDVDDLARFTADVRRGRLPESIYLVIGQPSLVDPRRGPRNQHVLSAYTHVPSQLDRPWSELREPFADRLEERIEQLAPGFRQSILARRAFSPDDLEADNANLWGGNHLGGSASWRHQLIWRPAFPYFRYRMPVRGLYLCSSFAHPGGGVHGMCGFNAARIALRDFTRRR
jgi:phytoene dehydrogenase-like protein